MTATANFAKPFPVSVTADANGAATVYAENTELGSLKPRPVFGDIVKVTYTPDPTLPIIGGAGLSIMLETSGEAVLMTAIAGGNQAWYPRVPLDIDPPPESGDLRYGPVYCHNERVKILVTGAGAGRKGTITVFVR